VELLRAVTSLHSGGRPCALRGAVSLGLLVSLFALGCGEQTTAPTSSGAITSASSGPAERLFCRRGSLAGSWIKNDGSETDGHIESAWLDLQGDTLGMLSAAFWIDSADGTPRFAGTVNGKLLPVVLLEVNGTWLFTDFRMCPQCGTSSGEFRGTWRDPRSGHRGRLSGEWGDWFLPFAERKMPLKGLWTAPCRLPDEIVVADRPN
jgi:hypothetical protein